MDVRLKADITAVEEKEREGLKSCCAGDGGDGAWHWSTVRTEDRKRHYLNICQPLAAMATEAQPPPQPVSGLRSECVREIRTTTTMKLLLHFFLHRSVLLLVS